MAFEAGGATRAGVLFRSAAPREGDLAPGLAHWPPATVVDLRGPDELGEGPHPFAVAGLTVHARPMLATRMVSGRAEWTRLVDLAEAYPRFLTEASERIAAIAELVATAEMPVLVHCTAGKDRTGVLVAVLLRAAGVRRGEVIRDYAGTRAELPAVLVRSAQLTSRFDPTVRQRLMGVSVPAIIAVLDLLDATPGGAGGWLRAAGMSELALRAWAARIH